MDTITAHTETPVTEDGKLEALTQYIYNYLGTICLYDARMLAKSLMHNGYRKV